MGYCVVCYLVTALLFSLLILDLAALVVTTCPAKAIFKYTDLVYVSECGRFFMCGGGGVWAGTELGCDGGIWHPSTNNSACFGV